MKKKLYKRKPGDFEIRILSDGRVVMVAPDETLLEIARELDPNSGSEDPEEQCDERVTGRQADAEKND